MQRIDKNLAPSKFEFEVFLKQFSFDFPKQFIEFYSESNGGYIISDNFYTELWSLSDMIQFNEEYNVEKYAPEYFIFASDGGGNAFVIEKKSGNIFELPFIGMSSEEAIFKTNLFYDFLRLR